MNTLISTVGIFLIIALAMAADTSGQTNTISKISPTPSAVPIFTTSPSPTAFIESFTAPTLIPFPTMTETPQPIQQKTVTDTFSEFVYPSANVIHQEETSMILESNDTPEAVTGWYKDKLSQFTLNIRNYVQTRTNERYFTSLLGVNNDREIKVEITKDTNQSVTRISVSNRNLRSSL